MPLLGRHLQRAFCHHLLALPQRDVVDPPVVDGEVQLLAWGGEETATMRILLGRWGCVYPAQSLCELVLAGDHLTQGFHILQRVDARGENEKHGGGGAALLV